MTDALGRSAEIQLILFRTLVLSVIDYGFGLMTLADTHLNRIDSIQNEAMGIFMGCTRDTSTAAMRHYLDLPTMKKKKEELIGLDCDRRGTPSASVTM